MNLEHTVHIDAVFMCSETYCFLTTVTKFYKILIIIFVELMPNASGDWRHATIFISEITLNHVESV